MSHLSDLVHCLGFVRFSYFITQNLSSNVMVLCRIMLHNDSACSYNNAATGSLSHSSSHHINHCFFIGNSAQSSCHETCSHDTGAALFNRVMKAAKGNESILLSTYWPIWE
jgi:hypothetical protein